MHPFEQRDHSEEYESFESELYDDDESALILTSISDPTQSKPRAASKSANARRLTAESLTGDVLVDESRNGGEPRPWGRDDDMIMSSIVNDEVPFPLDTWAHLSAGRVGCCQSTTRPVQTFELASRLLLSFWLGR